MSTRVLRTDDDRAAALTWLRSLKLPCTLSVAKGAKRSVEQNRLQRLWLNEISEQLGDRTAEEVRAYCKLHGAVPILREENEDFRDVYDRLIRPRSYEEKLELMAVPIDLPVTRLMTTHQKKRYLDWMWAHWTGEMGLMLTEPDWRKRS